MNRLFSIVLCALAAAAPMAALAEANYPAPCPSHDPGKLGRRIQRSISLMASSTPENRNTVKVLFYGQSITEQGWWKSVAEDLRKKFPHANLIIENRAIGGHSSQRLWKTAEADLYPFYPDLVIFHVYGSHLDYEKMIQGIRSRTTADVLLQTDHVTKDDALTEETDAAKLTPAQWDAWMNNSFLPSTAAKYGCELADVHNGWKRYLKSNNFKAQQLLRDSVHLNAQGEWVMGELVKRHLRYDASAAAEVDPSLVRTLEVGKDIRWQDGRLTLEFEGNRVDAICAEGTAPPATVLIDGQKPSALASCYAFTRTTGYLGTNWPCVLRVQSEALLQPEEWTITLKDASPDYKTFAFTVTGSKTGPDGEGKSDEKFVSKSRRIVIEPGDWNLDYGAQVFKKPLPADFAIKFQSILLGTDELVNPGIADKSLGAAVTLIQGVPNAKHKLEIQGSPQTPIRALRIYRPPWRG